MEPAQPERAEPVHAGPPGRAPRREIFAWAFYDFANSSFATVILTAVYVLYFTNVVVLGDDGDRLWGRAIALSMLLVGLSSPVLGAIADYSAAKKRFLMAYAGLCIVCTAALYFVGPGMVFLGMALFVLANVGFAGGNVFYDAFLPEIADDESMGRVSGYGWGVGYVGGMLSLAVVLPFAAKLKDGPAGASFARLAFPVTALFFLAASVPTFVWLKERAKPKALPEGESCLSMGFGRLLSTLKRVKQYRELAKFLVIFLIYNDAMTTVIVFCARYADKTFDFTMKENLGLLLLVNLFAAPGVYAFGLVADRIGSKRTILITLVVWTAVACLGGIARTKLQFAMVAVVAGLAMGAVQSVSRTLVGLFSPRSRSAEFFGFKAVCGKFAAVLGPWIFGEVSAATGSQRIAVLMVAGIFAVSFVALWLFVDEKAGIAAAREPDPVEE